MLDLIQDQAASEIHDIIRQHLASKHDEGSVVVTLFDLSVQSFLEEDDDVGLERFLQLQWDELDDA